MSPKIPVFISNLLASTLVGEDVEAFVRQLVSKDSIDAVEMRVIHPLLGFDIRNAAGPGLTSNHNDTDTQDPILFRDGDNLPEVALDDVLCFTSLVRSKYGEFRRLLLIDFRVPVSDEAQRDLEGHLTNLGWHGVLVMTGSSYHFLGVEMLSLDTWMSRMYKSLLIPGIDWRYVGHTLIRQAGAARFTTCPLKPVTPRIVAIINPSEERSAA